MITNYIPILCFVVGGIFGAALTVIGFRLGFRASYEIRQNKDGLAEDVTGLFKKEKYPAELDLLDEQ